MEYIIPGIIAILVLILIFTNIRIVPQTTEFVVERLGKYRATWTDKNGQTQIKEFNLP